MVEPQRSFDVKGYRRLEKWNNHMNILSTVLFFLAIIALPITYFSLEAARDGDTIINVVVEPLEIQWAEFVVYFLPAYIFPNNTIIQGKALVEEPEWPVVFGLVKGDEDPRVATPKYARIVTITPTKQAYFQLRFGEITLDTTFRRASKSYLQDYVTPCHHDKDPFVTTSTEDTISFSLCLPGHLLNGDRYKVMISPLVNHTDRQVYFQQGTINADIYFSRPPAYLTITQMCDSILCFLLFSENVVLSQNGEVKKQTGQSVVIQKNGPAALQVNQSLYEDFSLILLLLRSPFQTTSALDDKDYGDDKAAELQLELEGRFPDSISFQVFQEQDKYTTGDTLIDSFAISAIIVSGFLLAVTLAKLFLWMAFNPTRKR